MPWDVFISYEGTDHKHAQDLMAALTHHGFNCWKDSFQIFGGQPIPARIRQGISESKFLCAVVTPRYGKSYWARTEQDLMKRRENILAPVRRIPCLFEGAMPAFFGDVAFEDFRADFLHATGRLVATLRRHGDEHERRSTLAKWGAAAAATAIGLFWAGSGPTQQQQNLRLVLSVVPSDILGKYLRRAGHDVPPRKPERIAAIVEHLEPPQVLDELFTAEKLRALCSECGLPRIGKKHELIEALLSAELSERS